MQFRVGQGYDVHVFGRGDYIMLGGQRIEHTHGIVAHSDGDVVLHALCDAIYGAISEGDIGLHFPPSDPQWKSTPSMVFLKHAHALLEDKGWKISNIDVTVIAEAPKITPYRESIAQTVSDALAIASDQFSIKATTHEKMGALGRGEGIAALVNLAIYKD